MNDESTKHKNIEDDIENETETEIDLSDIRHNIDDDDRNELAQDEELIKKLTQFLLYFKERKYYHLIQSISDKENHGTSLTIDFDDIMLFDNTLYKNLIKNPFGFFELIKSIIYQIDEKYDIGYYNDKMYFAIKIHGYPNYVPIADIDVSKNLQLVSLRGNISKMSEIKPYIYQYYHKCKDCKRELYSDWSNQECPYCEESPTMKNDKNKNIYTNCQYIRIQELNEDLRGQVPKQVDCVVLGDNCKFIKAGSKINVTAFVQLTEIPNSMSIRTPFRILLFANNVEPFKSNVYADDEISIKDDDIRKINERLQNRELFLSTLINSFAPHVFGHELVKLALLLGIVGSYDFTVNGQTIRNRINICLVGDPGTSKTEMLKFGERITLGSVYVSGRGVTGGGITAILQKEKDGTFAIQPGALIFANNSILWFDEAAQVSDEVRSHLHESMESGTISLAKGGHVVSLQANTTIVFGANPKHSRYATDMSINENIDMPPTITSRFDLIFIIIDFIDKEYDRKVSRHIDHIVTKREIPIYNTDILPINELIKYINYAKEQNLDPEFTPEVLKMNEEFYVNIRQKSTAESLAATPRQKYGLMRLQSALARLLLQPKIDKWIAEWCIKLMSHVIETTMTDEQGNINVVNIEGKTVQKLQGTRLMIKIMKELQSEYDDKNKIPKERIREILKTDHKMSDKAIETFLMQMNDNGVIHHTSERHVRLSKSV